MPILFLPLHDEFVGAFFRFFFVVLLVGFLEKAPDDAFDVAVTRHPVDEEERKHFDTVSQQFTLLRERIRKPAQMMCYSLKKWGVPF